MTISHEDVKAELLSNPEVRKEYDALVERDLKPIHPGEILLKEFLKPLGISQHQFAKEIGIDRQRINAIVHGEEAIPTLIAKRFAYYFETSASFWLNLQTRYDLEVRKTKKE